jgi:hypothetical protein
MTTSWTPLACRAAQFGRSSMVCLQPTNRRLSTGRDRIDTRFFAGVSSTITCATAQERYTRPAEPRRCILRVQVWSAGKPSTSAGAHLPGAPHPAFLGRACPRQSLRPNAEPAASPSTSLRFLLAAFQFSDPHHLGKKAKHARAGSRGIEREPTRSCHRTRRCSVLERKH